MVYRCVLDYQAKDNLKQLDNTYVPTFDQNKQMFELELALKRLMNSNIKSQTFKNYVTSATEIFNSLVGAFNQTANTAINGYKALNPVKPIWSDKAHW